MTESGAWMPMYWGDYFGDTTHLSVEEHGAYLLLIGTYWRRGRALPDDDKWLASVTKMTTKKWKMVRPKVAEFFDILDGELRHKRIEKEILKSSARLSSARAAGKAGGLAKSKLTTTTVTKSKKVITRATKIPVDWQLNERAVDVGKEEGLNRDEIAWLADGFRNHAIAKGSKYIDWDRAFYNWLRSGIAKQDIARRRGRSGSSDGWAQAVAEIQDNL